MRAKMHKKCLEARSANSFSNDFLPIKGCRFMIEALDLFFFLSGLMKPNVLDD